MPYDALLMFSDAQAFTATAVSTNVVDLGAPSINPRNGVAIKVNHGGGNLAPIVLKVGAAFAGLTSVTVNLQSSPDDVTYTAVASSQVLPLATLVAGYEFGFRALPLRASERYWRLQYIVVGTGTGGTMTAGFADGFQTNGMV